METEYITSKVVMIKLIVMTAQNILDSFRMGKEMVKANIQDGMV